MYSSKKKGGGGEEEVEEIGKYISLMICHPHTMCVVPFLFWKLIT